ncbi:TPM domain-containing protein [Pelotalea chapellei]|uniref:TPM domain-containing protein n=1 Tax=Pelotalea chapellei TaxID=44671 RepID=A0ABS5U639_9BACT|nr:TPM domain-containing protein [Pelotalea chapellei]MBT1071124.1 TPM domain-containing protein [Pelotalea chapellei]
MTIKNSAILSAEQETAVQEAVKRAEARTSGEIVPMLVPSSGAYGEAACQAATLVAALVSLILAIVLRDTSIWFFLPVAFLLYFPALALVRRMPRLKIAFTPAARISDIVRDKAVCAFYEEGLHRTREQNGILIFISMLERRVWILGDHGINAVIPADHWISLASRLSAGIRQGTMTQSLTAVITEVGGILQQHFPSRSDDTNELPDLIRDRD